MDYTEKYKEILEKVEAFRTQIITDNMKYISFSGHVPKSELTHVEALLQVEGFLLSFISDTYDLPISQQDGIATITAADTPFTVPTKYLGYKKSAKEQPVKEPMQEKKVEDQPVKEPSAEVPVQSVKAESQKIEQPQPQPQPLPVQKEPEAVMENPPQDNVDIIYPAMPIDMPGEQEVVKKEPALQPVHNTTSDTNDIEKQLQMVNERLSQMQKPQQQAYSVIGEVTDSSDSFPKVIKRTPQEEVTYDRIKFTMTKKAGTPETFEVIASPLQMSNDNISSVPIIVVARGKGMQQIVASSYDNEDGRNTITLSIKDYEILIRGCFQDGVYKTIILTTGRSVEKGDIFEAVSILTHGSTNRTSEFGRPLLHYMSQEGLAWTTAVPLSDVGVEDFVIISKTPEFVDYEFHCADNLGGRRAYVYEDDNRRQVVPSWEDGMLELNIVNA